MAACTEAASAHRIQWVAFNLLNAGDSLAKLVAFTLDNALAFHQPHDGATAATAFATDGRVPLLFARDYFTFRNKQWDQRISLSAAAAGGYGRGDSRYDLEEVAAIHELKDVLPWRQLVTIKPC